MGQHPETLIVTLHWLAEGREQATTIICEDSAPAQLLPVLIAGCGLGGPGEDGPAQPYTLRLDAVDGRPLLRAEPVSTQGVHSGSHLWLSDRGAAPRQRWLLGTPDGSEIALPPRGVELTRGWLLGLLALLNPAAHLRELELLERRESPYAYVSKHPHCSLRFGPTTGWTVATGRADVATLLNGVRLFPETSEQIGDGDRLTLGAYGPTLTVSILEG